MNIAKDIAKRGWHPEKDGKGLSSVLRRDKDSSSSSSTSGSAAGSARPLSSLRDPASFAPPPKSVHHPNYDPAVDGPSSSAMKKPGPPLPQREAGARETPGRKPSTEEAEDEKPTGPFRVDTTGLQTTGLPPPPTRIISRADTAPITTSPSATRRAPPPAPPAPAQASPPSTAGTATVTAAAAKPKPALPPRLPPREEASPPLLNQGATDRLASAGVRVPGFGIGEPPAAGAPASTKPSLSGHTPGRDANVSELEARFAKIRATEREQEGSGASAPTPRAATRLEEPPPVPLATKPR